MFKHEYDALNQRIATTRPDGHKVSWLTYGSGHLLALKLDDKELVSYERDDLHREIGRVQGNGLMQRQTWSPNGQLLEQTLARQGESKRIAARSYRYDEAGQLCHINDLNRGDLRYRYDPVGRLIEASQNYEKETFAFDPASNLLDSEAPSGPNPHSPRKLMDNVLRSYCGTQYRYDERGNLLERIENGKSGKFTWDLYDRLRRYEDDRLVVEFGYDALGRRVYKDSRSKYRNRVQAGPVWNENARRALDVKLGCNLTLFMWDGDTLAFEQRGRDGKGRTTHYVFEPETFVPVAQGVMNHIEDMSHQDTYSPPYDLHQDPASLNHIIPKPFEEFYWYQCNHLGTPMELTGTNSKAQWMGDYKPWGQTNESHPNMLPASSFVLQGQYLDHETKLHYNRYRYYDPSTGRFIGKDPIGFAGGFNLYSFAPNPVEWLDPFGLVRTTRCLTLADCEKIIAASGRESGPHDKVARDSHHVIQKAAMLNIPGYGDGRTAYAVQLGAPANVPGTEHYIATQSQRQKGTGGNYASERVVGYRALRRAGLSAEESRCHIMFADVNLTKLGVKPGTATRIPGNRTSRGRKK